MKRMTEFADQFQLSVFLDPPYHSKYNPIERVWGVFEKHINGSLMESLKTVATYAKTIRVSSRKQIIIAYRFCSLNRLRSVAL